METSLFLAQFWGWLLVILGVIILFKKKALVEDLSRLVDDKGYAAFRLCGLTVGFGYGGSSRKSTLIFMDKILLIQALLVVSVLLGAWLILVSY